MSTIKVIEFDFCKPSAPISRPMVEDESLVHKYGEPIWNTKRKQFYECCGKNSIWKKPIAIIWAIAAIALVCYEIYCHTGERGVEYRHNASIETNDYFAAHGVFFPIHDFITVSGKHAGWTKQDAIITSSSPSPLLGFDIYQQSMFDEM